MLQTYLDLLLLGFLAFVCTFCHSSCACKQALANFDSPLACTLFARLCPVCIVFNPLCENSVKKKIRLQSCRNIRTQKPNTAMLLFDL